MLRAVAPRSIRTTGISTHIVPPTKNYTSQFKKYTTQPQSINGKKEEWNKENLEKEDEKTGFNSLHRASSLGNLTDVKKIVDAGVNVSSKSQKGKGMDALNLAAYNGHFHVVKYFVNELEIDLDKLQPAVLRSIAMDEFAILEQLLLMGVNVSGMRSPTQNLTPLELAAANNKTRIIETLVKYGLGVNSRGSNGATPLFYASVMGNPETIKLLLKLGADVNAQDEFHETPIFSAHTLANLRTLLDAGADVRIRNLLHVYAAASETDGPAERVELVLEKGAKERLEERDEHELTPLLVSASRGNIQAFKLFLDAGAKIDATERDNGLGILHLACSGRGEDPEGHLEVIKECIRLGLSLDSKATPSLMVPLHVAATFGFEPAILFLLDRGVNVDAQDMKGDTALHYAVTYEHVEIVNILLKAGARRDVKNEKDQVPLDIANEKEDLVLKLILEHE